MQLVLVASTEMTNPFNGWRILNFPFFSNLNHRGVYLKKSPADIGRSFHSMIQHAPIFILQACNLSQCWLPYCLDKTQLVQIVTSCKIELYLEVFNESHKKDWASFKSDWIESRSDFPEINNKVNFGTGPKNIAKQFNYYQLLVKKRPSSASARMEHPHQGPCIDPQGPVPALGPGLKGP